MRGGLVGGSLRAPVASGVGGWQSVIAGGRALLLRGVGLGRGRGGTHLESRTGTSLSVQGGGEESLLTVRGLENAALVFITAASVHEHQAEMIRTRLLALAERTHGRIAVSLENVTDMTSAGINALVAVMGRCKDLGGGLAVFGPSREVRRMLKVTRLDRAIVIADTPHEAVRAISRGGARKSFWASLSWARADRDAA